MPKFNPARQPYYILVAAFTALCAIVSYVNNTIATGPMSDVYLFLLAICLIVCGLSFFYLLSSKAGADDESDVEIVGLPVEKKYYYATVLAIAAWRAVVGYQLNHAATGIQSTWGVLWILGSIAVAAMTYANYKSYMTTHPQVGPQSSRRV